MPEYSWKDYYQIADVLLGDVDGMMRPNWPLFALPGTEVDLRSREAAVEAERFIASIKDRLAILERGLVELRQFHDTLRDGDVPTAGNVHGKCYLDVVREYARLALQAYLKRKVAAVNQTALNASDWWAKMSLDELRAETRGLDVKRGELRVRLNREADDVKRCVVRMVATIENSRRVERELGLRAVPKEERVHRASPKDWRISLGLRIGMHIRSGRNREIWNRLVQDWVDRGGEALLRDVPKRNLEPHEQAALLAAFHAEWTEDEPLEIYRLGPLKMRADAPERVDIEAYKYRLPLGWMRSEAQYVRSDDDDRERIVEAYESLTGPAGPFAELESSGSPERSDAPEAIAPATPENEVGPPKKQPRKSREVLDPLIADYVSRHPHTTISEVAAEIRCSTGLVCESPAWKELMRLREAARDSGGNPFAVSLNADQIAAAGREPDLDELIGEQAEDNLTDSPEVPRREQRRVYRRV